MRSAVVIASLALGGCFYIDPINQRPSLDIRQDTVTPVFRGEPVSFTAVALDPDDHDVNVTWRAYMCTDAADPNTCDDPLFTDVTDTFGFTVPMTTVAGAPVSGMRIVLDGKDDHGATAKPNDILELPVLDRNPDLRLSKASLYDPLKTGLYVVNTPVDLYAIYTDGDDALDTLTVDWKVFSPMQVPITLVDIPIQQTTPGSRDVAKQLTPQIEGEWIVDVTVSDPGGHSVNKMLSLNVVPDRAPCISVVSPIVPPSPQALQVMDPTLFQVPLVSDDLDSYPKTSGGQLYGEPKFVWSILSPGNSRQVISGATGSSTLFDPAAFSPGTIVELRVEIQDRKLTPVNCADGDATCSTTGGNSCFQRQTWKVEAR